MPELCRIYVPVKDGLHTHIIMYRGDDEGWKVTIDDQIITVQEFSDLQKVVDFVAERNGWFTDYREAKNYIARQK